MESNLSILYIQVYYFLHANFLIRLKHKIELRELINFLKIDFSTLKNRLFLIVVVHSPKKIVVHSPKIGYFTP
jgi:hypothetical protein